MAGADLHVVRQRQKPVAQAGKQLLGPHLRRASDPGSALQQIGAAIGITVLTALMADSVDGTRFLLLHLVAAGAGLLAAWLATGIREAPDVDVRTDDGREPSAPSPAPSQV